MDPWAMPVYVPLGKEVRFWPEPSVRGKKATGFGTSAVNVGGYTLPMPDCACPAQWHRDTIKACLKVAL